MDFQAILFNPIYAVQGVPATLALAPQHGGAVFEDLTTIDKTAGVDIGGEGSVTFGKMAVAVPTIKPACIFRMAELTALGITAAMLPRGSVTFNGHTWTIVNVKPKPSPKGEGDGEILLVLTDKQAEEDMAMAPGVWDLVWVRGSNSPFVFRLKADDAPLPFDDVRFTVKDGDGVLLFRVTLSENSESASESEESESEELYAGGTLEVTDEDEGEITFTPTTEQTRALPNTAPFARYEVEVRNGSQQDVYLVGEIVGTGGLNDD